MKKQLNRIEAKLDEILRVETQLLKNTANVNGSKGLLQTIQAWSDSSKNGVCLSERGELVYDGTQSIIPAQDIIINNLPSEPDWSKAAERYEWFAIDADGIACFYENEPYISEAPSMWKEPTYNADIEYLDGTFDSSNWRNSLRQRPKSEQVTITANLNADTDGYLAGKKSFITAYVDLLLARMTKEGRFSAVVACEKSQEIKINDVILFQDEGDFVFGIVNTVLVDCLGISYSAQQHGGKWITTNWFDIGLENTVIRRITQAEAVEFRAAMEAVYG